MPLRDERAQWPSERRRPEGAEGPGRAGALAARSASSRARQWADHGDDDEYAATRKMNSQLWDSPGNGHARASPWVRAEKRMVHGPRTEARGSPAFGTVALLTSSRTSFGCGRPGATRARVSATADRTPWFVRMG